MPVRVYGRRRRNRANQYNHLDTSGYRALCMCDDCLYLYESVCMYLNGLSIGSTRDDDEDRENEDPVTFPEL